jgi:hypothetical protein
VTGSPYLSGTEYEFDTAYIAYQSTGRPGCISTSCGQG